MTSLSNSLRRTHGHPKEKEAEELGWIPHYTLPLNLIENKEGEKLGNYILDFANRSSSTVSKTLRSRVLADVSAIGIALTDFRLNEGNVKRPTMERLESLVKGAVGKRLTYQALIAD